MPLTEVPVPTAAELSVPGALQAYIDSCVTNGWDVVLPRGTITGNIALSGSSYRSLIIRGAGFTYQAHAAGTMIVPYDTNIPTIQIRNCSAITLKDFSIWHPQPEEEEPNEGIGISLEGSNGAFIFHTKIENVGFLYCDAAIRVSEPPGTRVGQNAAADVIVTHCIFTRCTHGVQVNHNQSVNIHVTGQCYFYTVDEAVRVNNGGRVLISDCCSNPVGVWLRILASGSDLHPFIIRNLYSDGTGGADPSVVVDARGCPNPVKVLIDGYSLSSAASAPSDFIHFYLPDGNLTAANNSIIRIQDPDFFNAPGNKVPYNTLNPATPPIEPEVRIDRLPDGQTIGKVNGTQLSFPSDGTLRVSNAAGDSYIDITPE